MVNKSQEPWYAGLPELPLAVVVEALGILAEIAVVEYFGLYTDGDSTVWTHTGKATPNVRVLVENEDGEEEIVWRDLEGWPVMWDRYRQALVLVGADES